MINITILSFVMLITQCLALASPQDVGREAAALKAEKLARKLEKTVSERKEGWFLEKRQLAGARMYNRWTAGKRELSITTGHEPSAEEASRILQISSNLISAPHTTTKITGFGDEAYLVRIGKEHCTIMFRKDNMIVYVEASKVADAETFAKLAADSLSQP